MNWTWVQVWAVSQNIANWDFNKVKGAKKMCFNMLRSPVKATLRNTASNNCKQMKSKCLFHFVSFGVK